MTKYDYISIKDLAALTGVSQDTLTKRCQREKYSCRRVPSAGGKNGSKYEILISSLEIELQTKLFDVWNKQREETVYNPTAFQKYSLVIEGANNSAVCPVSLKNFVPDNAKKIALAKFNVVDGWNDYCKDKTNKKTAGEEFLLLYSNSIIFAKQRNLLGKISLGSIYRWNKILKDNNNNYYSLINNYKYASESQLNTTLSDEEKQAFIKLYYNDSRLDMATAYNLLKYQFGKKDIAVKSLATYRRFAKFIERNHNDFEVLAREGEKALKDKVVPSIRRDTSFLTVGDILVADGNKLDFMIINPYTGKPARAIMVVFMDWYSLDFVGYEIMFSENTQCISSALRNSIIRLGKFPKVVYMDNGRAFRGKYFTGTNDFSESNFKGIYAQLGIKTTFAKPYNGKAKIIERSFGEFVKSCPPLIGSYIGSSIQKQPAHLKRNEKFHKELHNNDKIPTLEQAKMIIEEWLKYYRSKQHNVEVDKTIEEVVQEGKGKGVNPELLDELMMSSEIRNVKRNTIKIFGYEYVSDDLYGIKDRVQIKYSLFDLSAIKVYSLKGEYICEAKTVIRYNAMAKYFGSATDMYSLKQAQKKQNELIKGSLNKTKLLMAATNPIDDVEWSKEQVVSLEEKRKKPKYEVTAGYENAHLYMSTKRKYNI